MDGVPVKISEKYKPPKKISLPGSVLNKITVLKESKFEDYDFSFERAVLAQIGRINDHKKSVQEKKKELEEEAKKLENSKEMFNVVSPASPPSPPASTVSSSEAEAIPAAFKIPPAVNANIDILAPLSVSNNAQAKEKRYVDNSILSEFDSDTSSPFDNMELKSINDLQELADVLGSSNKSVKEDKVKPINGVVDGTEQWKNTDQRNYSYPRQYYPYGGQVIPSAYPTYQPHLMASEHKYSQNFITDYKIHPVNVPNSTYQPHSPSLSPPYVSSIPPPLPPKPPSLSSNPTSYSAYTSPAHSYKYAQSNHTSVQPKPYPDYSVSQQPSPSRKVDQAELSLWTELHKTLLDRKTTNQEQQFDKQVTSASRGIESVTVSTEPVPTLPNPLQKLNQECQNLAHRMSEMGFPLPRSARAVQLFESDEAKVIEFLLLVQNFEDRHFPGDLVETALISNNYNEDSTIIYLENVKKLKDFGFSEEQVVKALEKTNNDTDRALDLLIT